MVTMEFFLCVAERKSGVYPYFPRWKTLYQSLSDITNSVARLVSSQQLTSDEVQKLPLTTDDRYVRGMGPVGQGWDQ